MLANAAILHHPVSGAPVDDDSPLPVKILTFELPDLTIGAVELKDAETVARAKIGALSGIVEGDNGLPVTDPVTRAILGALADAAVLDANGSVNAHIRGVAQLLALLSRGNGAMDAQTLRVVTASDGPLNAVLGALTDAAVLDANGSVNAHLRGLVTLLGITTGAAVITDANGTHQQYLRGLVKLLAEGTGSITAKQAQVSTAVATIANAASLTAGIDLGTARLARLAMPAAWTTADITFQASHDGAAYNDLYDSYGGEYLVKAAASRSIMLPIADFLGVRFLKIRSGTAAVPVAQGAQRDINYVAVN